MAKALDRLARKGLVARARYRLVFLTATGAGVAHACCDRHQVVVAFLVRPGLYAESAERDAEGIEHHVSARTLALLRDFAASGQGG